MSPSTHDLLSQLAHGSAVFADVLAHIEMRFHFTPTAFNNNGVVNALGQNSGSARVLAFAQHERLTHAQTLTLFAEHYAAVLQSPNGHDHANIRALQAGALDAVTFEQFPLQVR